jgi:hypothetical protein
LTAEYASHFVPLKIAPLLRAFAHSLRHFTYVGFLNRAGRLVIPAHWSLAEAFSQGRALVSVEQKWGAIDKRGHVVVKPQYTYAEVKAKLEAERQAAKH